MAFKLPHDRGSMQRVLDEVAAARAAFKVSYRAQPNRGYLRNLGAAYRTYAIDVSYFDNGDERWWDSKIEVHGDEALRDRILAMLTSPDISPDIERLQKQLQKAQLGALDTVKESAANLTRALAAEAALKPFAAMRLSTEPEFSDLVLRSPAEEMRRQAEAIEAHDRAILAARATIQK